MTKKCVKPRPSGRGRKARSPLGLLPGAHRCHWQHPSTGEKDWCGEHKPDISDAIDAPTEPPKDAQ